MAKRVFFCFHYQDVIDFRANVVRNHWMTKPDREEAGYFDASVWESARRQGDTSLKRLINGALENTSNTCVLIGSQTYERPWFGTNSSRASAGETISLESTLTGSSRKTEMSRRLARIRSSTLALLSQQTEGQPRSGRKTQATGPSTTGLMGRPTMHSKSSSSTAGEASIWAIGIRSTTGTRMMATTISRRG